MQTATGGEKKNTTLPTRVEQTRCLSQDNEPGGAARARPSACSPVSHALTDSAVRASSLGREKGRHESGTRQLITGLQDARCWRKVTHKNTGPPPTPNALHYHLPFTGARRAAGDVTAHLRHESALADGASDRNAPGERRKMLTWVTYEELLCGSVCKLACSNNNSSRWVIFAVFNFDGNIRSYLYCSH